MGQVTNLISLKRNATVQDGVQADSSTPDINWWTAVTDRVLHNLRRDVGWRAALLSKELVRAADPARDAEVANFNITLTVEKDIIKLDIAMDNVYLVHVFDSLHDLLEKVLGVLLC